MNRSLLTVFWLICASAFSLAEVPAADLFSKSWRVDNSIYKGPPGSLAIFGPLVARTSDAAVAERLGRVKQQYKEVSRVILPGSSGRTFLKVVFEVPIENSSYLSPHYFVLGSDGRHYCIKTIPSSKQYQENAQEIEEVVLRIEPSSPPK